jgi:glycosyltransferase involved in cell wall biosynthesis
VFVLDHYEPLRAKLLQDFTPRELDAYVAVNATALRELLPADVVFANHVLLGGAVGAASGAERFAVKAHGSELEYSMRGRPELERWGAEALAEVERVREVPPGVDVEEFRPEKRPAALAALLAEARNDPPNPGNRDERNPDEGNAGRLAEFFGSEAPTVLYFGKLIENKGVHVLFDALRGLDARAVIVGFGDYRAELERRAPRGTLFTGPLEHRHLVHLLPLVDAAVVPSIFPEAFGMVAAEAAAAGILPIVAAHSGLAEVAAGIAAELPPARAHLTSFPTGDANALRERLRELLALSSDARGALGLSARRAVARNWSWMRVAERLLEPFAG